MTDCYIIGCGPKGPKGYNLIPQKGRKILLNAAVKLVDQFEWEDWTWMVSDNTFLRAVRTHHYCYKHKLWGSGQVAEKYEVTHEFQENPWMTLPSLGEDESKLHVNPIENVLRGGGTVAGCALHLCYWMGVRPILCGIDMAGTSNAQEDGKEYGRDHWSHYTTILNEFIKQWIPETRTLTETNLEVESI